MIPFLTSCLNAIFGTKEECEPCQECMEKKTVLLEEGGKACVERIFLQTFKDISHLPRARLVETGCFLKVHPDKKVCLFRAEPLSGSENTMLYLRTIAGLATIDNHSLDPVSLDVPKTEDIQPQTLFVKRKSEETFQIFHLWSCFLFAILSLHAHEPYLETLHPHWTQSFEVENVLHREQSDFWDLILFENPHFGKVLAIDGVIQLTEADEPFYSEMMAHTPLLAHGNASSVLIIGGGDGCILREVLKHPVEHVTLVEIDRKVVEIAQTHFPELLDGAFDDPRLELILQDAAAYVKDVPRSFDVILCDSTDPVGAATALFTKEFYANCKNCLNKGGIFVNQNGVPFLQREELEESLKNRQELFRHASFYVTAVPTYIGGLMTLGWSSDTNYAPSREILEMRFEPLKGKTKYYNPAIHQAAFALPECVKQ